MAMQDAEEINNLFHNVSQEVETFTDKQLVWMQDTTSTSNQQLVFDNSSIMSRATIWKTAFIRIPFHWQASTVGAQITVAGNNITIDPYSPGATPLALKCGPASIFTGVQVNLSTGTGILNDQAVFIMNQIRPKIEMNDEGLNTYGSESGYTPDYFPNANVAMSPLFYGGPGALGTNLQKPAFGASLNGVSINGVPIAQDYSVANTAIYNQPFENILNPTKIIAICAANDASGLTKYSAAGVLQNSPSAYLGTNVPTSATAGTYDVPLTPENFVFSSNALVAIQQPAVVRFTIAATGLVTSAASIIGTGPAPANLPAIGAGYGTDGTIANQANSNPESQVFASTNGAALQANCFTAQLRPTAAGISSTGVSTTNLFLVAATSQLPIFVVQVGFAIPGLVPQETEPDYRQGYSDLSCKNPFYNQGFQKRIQSWWANTELAQQAGAGLNAVYRTNVIVRLSNIHDFYKQLDFPLENTRLQTLLSLAAPFNISASGSAFGMHYGTPVVANPPIFQISQSPTLVGNTLKQGVTNGSCTMYLNAVTFPADSAVRLKNALSNPTGGLIKQLSFLETEVTLIKAASTDATLTAQIQTTSTRVKRVWICAFPSGSNATLGAVSGNFPNAGFTSQTLSIAQPFAGMIPTGRVNNCVLRVNGQPWRQNPLTNDWEFWSKIREQMVGFGEDETVGSKLDYIQWLTGVGVFYVYDLQRQGVRPSINDPLLLGVDITRVQDLIVGASTPWSNANGYSPVDWYCILEKESLVQLNIGTANAAAIKQF